MSATSSGRLRSGLLAVLGFAVAARTLPPAFASLTALRERATAARSLAAQSRGLVDAEPALRDSLRVALAEVVGLAPLLLDGGTRAEAAASLSGWLSATSAQLRFRVRRVESLPDSSAGPIASVRLRANIEGDIACLGGLLRLVERGSLLLTVVEIGVTALDPASPSSAPEILRVEVVIGGLYLQRDVP